MATSWPCCASIRRSPEPHASPEWAMSLRTPLVYPGFVSPLAHSRRDLLDSESVWTLTRNPKCDAGRLSPGGPAALWTWPRAACEGWAPRPDPRQLRLYFPVCTPRAPVKTRLRPTVPGSTLARRHLESHVCTRCTITPPGAPAAFPGGSWLFPTSQPHPS